MNRTRTKKEEAIAMNEITPDAPDWDEYEAEQVRMHPRRTRRRDRISSDRPAARIPRQF